MKALLNPWMLLGAVLVLGATSMYSFLQGVRAERGAQAVEEAKLAAVEERAQLGAAKAIAKIKITNTTIRQELEREIVNNPLPDTCRLSDDGVRYLNAIIEGQPLPARGIELSEADAAGGRADRNTGPEGR